ncbi:MAG: hypothetical protein K6F93_07160 [Lachnospiraceae bacterium]|nr:hypothetical protein [Lachnospiraceae bacterium]
MKQKTLRKIACLGIMALSAGALVGCAQTQEPSVKIVSDDVSDEYSMVEVDYGDVVLEQQISCLYSQVSEENLSFSIENRELTHIYVSDGDSVKEGQAVAKLNVDDLEKKVRDNEDLIEQCDLIITETNKLIDYYEGILSGSASLKKREEIEFKISDAKQQLDEVESEKKGALRENNEFGAIIEKSVLYAGMDGTVSSINKSFIGTRPSKGATVMKIINTDHCSFISRNEEAFELLNVGDPVTIDVSEDKRYNATVIEKDAEGGRVIMDLDEPDYSIKMSTRGTINIELERADNVLTLPREAVHTTEDMAYVYRLTDKGVRELAEIEVGIMGTNLVEIKNGLVPYEQVILRKGKIGQ